MGIVTVLKMVNPKRFDDRRPEEIVLVSKVTFTLAREKRRRAIVKTSTSAARPSPSDDRLSG